MKMEVTQSIIIVENTIEYMFCFYKITGTFFNSHIVDNWPCYSKCSRMILHHLLLNQIFWVYFYYGIICGVFIV